MIKAIIFDMDGVLIDSIKVIWDSFSEVLGINFSDDYIKQNLATSLRDNLKKWETDFGIKDYDLMEFSKEAGDIQLNIFKKQKINPNLLKLLNKLKEKGIKCAIATSSVRWRTEEILKILNITNFFEVVVTSEDVVKHKPNPDVFLKASELLEIKPENCVVIEDARNGIEGAKNANMKAIGLITNYNSAEELKHADLVIYNLSEINLDKII